MSESQEPKLKTIHWVDMIVGQPRQVARFYADVAGYGLEEYDEGGGRSSFSLLDGDSKPVFGICDAAVFPNWIGGWVLYIDVDDFDARVSRIEPNGGEIIGQVMILGPDEDRRKHCLFKDPSGAGVMIRENRRGMA